jgi:hypothetical protein
VEDRVPTPGLDNVRRSVQISDCIVCVDLDRGRLFMLIALKRNMKCDGVLFCFVVTVAR